MDGVDCENVVEAGDYDPNDDHADLADLEDHQLMYVAIDRWHMKICQWLHTMSFLYVK